MLTRRQAEVLSVLRLFVQQHGYAPTLAELGRQLGVRSVATVSKLLTALENKGLIEKNKNKERAIRIRGSCPYCGRVGDEISAG